MAKNKCCRTCGCPRMADEPSPKNTSSEGEEARPKLPSKQGRIDYIQEANFQRAQRANRTGRKY